VSRQGSKELSVDDKNIPEAEHQSHLELLASQEQEIAQKLTCHEDADALNDGAGDEEQFHLTQVRHSEGPIPDPETLREYERVIPGLASALIKAFHDESLHRRTMESRAMTLQERGRTLQERELGCQEQLVAQQGWLIKANMSRSTWGMLVGALLAFTSLGLTAYCAYIGQSILAGILGSSTTIGLATVFVTGKQAEQKKAIAQQMEEEEQP